MIDVHNSCQCSIWCYKDLKRSRPMYPYRHMYYIIQSVGIHIHVHCTFKGEPRGVQVQLSIDDHTFCMLYVHCSKLFFHIRCQKCDIFHWNQIQSERSLETGSYYWKLNEKILWINKCSAKEMKWLNKTYFTRTTWTKPHEKSNMSHITSGNV